MSDWPPCPPSCRTILCCRFYGTKCDMGALYRYGEAPPGTVRECACPCHERIQGQPQPDK